MEPPTIVVSFDVGEQVVLCGIPGWEASLVHELGFQSAEAAFHRCIALCRLLHRASLDGASNRLRPAISLRLMGWIIPAAPRTLW